jgi:uncharacterized protein (DUF2336 family)
MRAAIRSCSDDRHFESVAMTSSVAATATILDELEDTLAHGNVRRRVEMLEKITDLFLVNADNFDDAQASVFDDVFEVLVRRIEVAAKALLSRRLAPIAAAPPRIVHALAFDDEIEVAAPILTQSERVTEATLVETAERKSQAHLLAISKRRRISSAVTDVLVERGDTKVVNSVVANLGAEFSENGYARLLDLSERDDDLATCVGARPTIPRHHFVKLLSRASSTVRSRLQALNVEAQAEVSSAVQEATTLAHERSAADSASMIAAQKLVEQLHSEGKLGADEIRAFAEAGKFEETNAALALLANVAVSQVETMMVKSQSEGVMILAKVSDLPWSTVKAVLDMRTGLSGTPKVDLDFCRVGYNRLKPATAQQVLRFQRMRSSGGA